MMTGPVTGNCGSAAMRKVISWERVKNLYHMAGTGTLGR